ncbi:MAG: helix-turn-helix domain-containing protein [Alphaproteobacteria bacterium]|jgi:DNA-binding XRE family transcriptional regulator|nr:helix-turn-helix domain-containing protein [Alphaproteobacteria bacterium]
MRVAFTRQARKLLEERIEDRVARVALIQARLADDGTRIPLEVVKAEIGGAHPVAAWRTYRGLTVAGLAEKAGINEGRLSEIENGRTAGDADAQRALSEALDVPADLLIPEKA